MDNFNEEIRFLSRSVLERCRALGWKVATAESCTGGLIVGAMTEIAGSSDVVDRGFITYSNEAKIEMLNVPVETLVAHGAVSEQTARAMALGALANAKAIGNCRRDWYRRSRWWVCRKTGWSCAFRGRDPRKHHYRAPDIRGR